MLRKRDLIFLEKLCVFYYAMEQARIDAHISKKRAEQVLKNLYHEHLKKGGRK